jgi:hypothetical protein
VFRFLWSLVVMIACLAGTIRAAAGAADDVCWPLALETRYLTGNFMESRGGRFHTAIDLKTEERTGIPVLAVRDGWISRIKTAPDGYGKALYLTDERGWTYVYAHLERLGDAPRERIRARQRSTGRYRCDLHLAAGDLPVRQGEVIALSGRTGTDGPHLHFEVRDPAGMPVNPLLHGFAVQDTIAPEILAVRVWWGNRVYRHGDGERPLAGELPPLALPPGPARVSARIVERSDHLRYRLAPFRVELAREGGPLVARDENRRLRWRDVRAERLVHRETALGRERALWVPGVGGAWRSGEDAAEIDGPGTYVLTATDVAGNASIVRWPLRIEQDADLPEAAGWILETADRAAARRPGDVLDLSRATWGRTVAVRDDGREGARLGVLVAPLAVAPPRGGPELVGAPAWFLPGHPYPWERLRDPLTVAWPRAAVADAADLGDRRVGVYRLDDEAWEWAGRPERTPVGWVHVLDAPGPHVLGRDDVAPRLEAPGRVVLGPATPGRRGGVTLPAWPPLVIEAHDAGSGVDWDAVRVTLDGAPHLAEPDPPRDRLLVELDPTLAAGPHTVAVHATDRAGNAAATRVVVVVGGAR